MTLFAEHLRAKMDRARISFSKLAETIDVPLHKIQYWEETSGKNMLASEAYRLSRVLNWPVDEMVDTMRKGWER